LSYLRSSQRHAAIEYGGEVHSVVAPKPGVGDHQGKFKGIAARCVRCRRSNPLKPRVYSGPPPLPRRMVWSHAPANPARVYAQLSHIHTATAISPTNPVAAIFAKRRSTESKSSVSICRLPKQGAASLRLWRER
jgi:hypothetical protein